MINFIMGVLFFADYFTVTLHVAVLPLYVLKVIVQLPFATAVIFALLPLVLTIVATFLFELDHVKFVAQLPLFVLSEIT